MKQGSTGGGPGSAAGGSGGGGQPPSVMTPSEAAGYLRVSEEDVVAAIEGGQLKAKKIGNAYRVSREALDEYLKS